MRHPTRTCVRHPDALRLSACVRSLCARGVSVLAIGAMNRGGPLEIEDVVFLALVVFGSGDHRVLEQRLRARGRLFREDPQDIRARVEDDGALLRRRADPQVHGVDNVVVVVQAHLVHRIRHDVLPLRVFKRVHLFPPRLPAGLHL